MTKGEKLKEARLLKGMTLEELAKDCGTTKQTINKYESGIVTNIPSDRLERMCEILDISPSYIMGWEDEKNILIETTKNASEDQMKRILAYAKMVMKGEL